MSDYKGLLQSGLCELEEFRRNKDFGSTYLDPSLIEPFLSQVIALNKYMSTFGSTNFPSNSKIQAMFVEGWILKRYLTPELLADMKKNQWDYQVVQQLTCCGPKSEEDGKILFQHHLEDGMQRVIAHDLLFKWWYGPGAPHHLGRPEFKEFQKNIPPAVVSLRTKMLERYHETGFVEMFKTLSEEDHKLLSGLATHPLLKKYYGKPDNWNRVRYNVGQSNYCCKAKDLIEKGLVVHLLVGNEYDPTDRNLYSELARVFQKHVGS